MGMPATSDPLTTGVRGPSSRTAAVVGLVIAAFALGAVAAALARGEYGTPSGAELSVADVYAKAADGVVRVEVTPGPSHPSLSAPPDRDVVEPSGSGFVFDRLGRVVTSAHVVAGASAIHVRLADGSLLPARLVAGDPAADVAVLDVDAPAGALRPLTLGDSLQVEVGEGVIAIGSPFGLQNSITAGIVSAVGRSISSPDSSVIADVIQTDAAINRGNSGGPLLDMQGNVIGLVAQFQSASGGSNGVGLAVPSNTVQAVVARLLASQGSTAERGDR